MTDLVKCDRCGTPFSIYVVVAAVLFSIVLDLVSDRKEAAR